MVVPRISAFGAVLLAVAAPCGRATASAWANASAGASTPPPDPAAAEKEAMRNASARAESAIAELQQWNAQMKSDLKSKDFLDGAARAIMSKAKADFSPARQDLNRSFEIAMIALDPAALATANESMVHEAVAAAKSVIKQYEHMDSAEQEEAHKTVKTVEKTAKDKAKALWKIARRAAKEAYHFGKAASKAQRHAGLPERVYEREDGHAEEVSERLLGRAEETAERAEDLAERESEKVEARVEKARDKLEDAEEHFIHSLQERVHRAEGLVATAREAAEEKAATAKVATEATTTEQAAKKDGEAMHAETAKQAGASGFLAREPSHGAVTASLAVPVACAAAFASAAAALLASRHCRAPASKEHPLLG